MGKTVTVDVGAAAAAATLPPPASVQGTPAAPVAPAQADDSETGRFRGLFARAGACDLLAAFFVFGVLLAFTPCMLPMIPILSGIIAGQGTGVTRRRALGLSTWPVPLRR